VWHATSFRQRLAGIRGVPVGDGVVMRTASVHGRGLSAPLHVIWLDGSGTIIERTTLQPGGTARCRGAVWAIEVPWSATVPGAPGDAVVLVQCSSPCPEH
jgi:uncharacterized membrane protein (UPF0127 family)